MKKKKSLTLKDKKDWIEFTKNPSDLFDKDINNYKKEERNYSIKKLDLHGYTLDEAHVKVREFINESFENDVKKIIIITGKGLRSKVDQDPYRSKEGSILKYSVWDFINNDKSLLQKIMKISKADEKEGGGGAISILLKNKLR